MDILNKNKKSDKRTPFKKRSQGKFREREKSEFDQNIVDIRRVTRVMAGGRRFSFSVALVLGDRNGRVGVGLGKAGDTRLAINKAVNDAKRNLIKLKLTKNASIPHSVVAKFCASKVTIRPARALIAGSSVRSVLELAGVRGGNAKILSRSKNKLNNAKAAILALKEVSE